MSYSYTKPIASKIFKYKKALQDFKFNDPSFAKQITTDSCGCSLSRYKYGPVGHVITGDLNIVSNTKLKQMVAKGPKYRQALPINWSHNFKLLMDSVEDYARKWA